MTELVAVTRAGRRPARWAAGFAVLLTLAACGVEGDPRAPGGRKEASPPPAIEISGTVEIGVASGR